MPFINLLTAVYPRQNVLNAVDLIVTISRSMRPAVLSNFHLRTAVIALPGFAHDLSLLHVCPSKFR